MSSTYSIGDEISSSNYRPEFCNKCQADRPQDCICDNVTAYGNVEEPEK